MRHAVTLEKLARYLERNDWSYTLVEDNQLIRTSFRGKNAVFEVLIVLDDRRGRVRFVLPNLFVLQPTRVNLEILKELLVLNMRYILVKFGFDPEDGEVRVEVDVPIEGGDLTFESFQRSLFSLLSVVDEVHPLLSRLIYDTDGSDPSEFQPKVSDEQPLPGNFDMPLNTLSDRSSRSLPIDPIQNIGMHNEVEELYEDENTDLYEDKDKEGDDDPEDANDYFT